METWTQAYYDGYVEYFAEIEHPVYNPLDLSERFWYTLEDDGYEAAYCERNL